MSATTDLCPRCGGDHDRIDAREPCPQICCVDACVRAATVNRGHTIYFPFCAEHAADYDRTWGHQDPSGVPE